MGHMNNCAPFFARGNHNLIIIDTDKDDIFWSNGSKCHLFLMPKKGNGFKMEG